MKKFIAHCLMFGFALVVCLGGVNAQDSGDENPGAYRHFDVKIGGEHEFKTPGLLKNHNYQLVAAQIPGYVVEVIKKSYPDTRIFFDSVNRRIKIVSIYGDELATFPLLEKSQLLQNFTKFEDDQEHTKISLIPYKLKTYIVGSIAQSNSKKIPIEDLAFSTEGRRSFVAVFTLTVSKKKSQIPNNNVSLLVSPIDPEAPKGYQALVRAIEKYVQVLTAIPFNSKEMERLTNNFEQSIRIIDELKAKYPEQNEHLESVRNSLLELSQKILEYLGGNYSRANLRTEMRLPKDITTLAIQLEEKVNRAFNAGGEQDKDKGGEKEKDPTEDDRQPDGRGAMNCQRCTSPNVVGSTCTQEGRGPIKCKKDGKEFTCSRTIGGQECPKCPKGQDGEPPNCTCPKGTYYIIDPLTNRGSCREPWDKKCNEEANYYRSCRYEDANVDPDKNGYCGCIKCDPPGVMAQYKSSSQILQCRDPENLKPCPGDGEVRVYDPVEGEHKCKAVEKPNCPKPQEHFWNGKTYECKYPCPNGRGRSSGECLPCPNIGNLNNQEMIFDPTTQRYICTTKCQGYRDTYGKCQDCYDIEPKGTYRNGKDKCVKNCDGPQSGWDADGNCTCYLGYTLKPDGLTCECNSETKDLILCSAQQYCCVDNCPEGKFRNEEGVCKSCEEMGKASCASECCEAGKSCINGACKPCNTKNPCDENHGGCGDNEICVPPTIPGSNEDPKINPACYGQETPKCKCKRSLCGESATCCSSDEVCVNDSCTKCDPVRKCERNNGNCGIGFTCEENSKSIDYNRNCYIDPTCSCDNTICTLDGGARQCCAEGEVCGANNTGCVKPEASPPPPPNCGTIRCDETEITTCCQRHKTCLNPKTCPNSAPFYDPSDCLCKTVTPVVSPIEPPPVVNPSEPEEECMDGYKKYCAERNGKTCTYWKLVVGDDGKYVRC